MGEHEKLLKLFMTSRGLSLGGHEFDIDLPEFWAYLDKIKNRNNEQESNAKVYFKEERRGDPLPKTPAEEPPSEPAPTIPTEKVERKIRWH